MEFQATTGEGFPYEETASSPLEKKCFFEMASDGSLLSFEDGSILPGGYALQEVNRLNFFQLIHPLEAAAVKEAVHESSSNQTPVAQTGFRLLGNGDAWYPVKADFRPRTPTTIAVTVMAAGAANLTNPVTAYDQFFYHHPLPMFITDAEELDFLDLNESAILHYGYTREDLHRMNLAELRVPDDTPALRAELKKRMVYHGEDRHRKKDGSLIYVEVVAHKSIQQGRAMWMSTVTDITERKKAEQRLAASELGYRKFVEQSISGIWRFDLRKPMPLHYNRQQIIAHFYQNCYLAECNDAMAQMYGLEKKEDLIGKDCAFFLPPGEPESLRFFDDFINQNFKVRNSVSYEKDIHGNRRVFLNNYSAHIDNGQIFHTWGTQMDITQQKADEKSIEYLASIVENAADAIYTLNAGRQVVTWNKACEKLTGVKATEIKGQPLREFFFYRSLSSSFSKINRAIIETGSWKGEVLLEHKKTGARLYVLVYIIAQREKDGKINRFLVFSRDISENKRVASLLKESEERFIHLAERAPAMIYIVDEKDQAVYFNQEWLQFSGRTLEEEIRANSSLDIYPDEREKVQRTYYTNTLARRQFEVSYRRRNHQGAWRWVLDRCMPRFLEDGTYVGYMGFCFDIHERKKAEEEALRQAVQFSGMFNGITDGFLATDDKYVVTMCNREAERLFGRKPEELVGKPLHIAFKAYKDKAVAKPLNEALLQKKPFQFEEYAEATGYWLGTNVYPYRDGVFIYFKDITSRRRREMLLEVQKQLLGADILTDITWENLSEILNRGIASILPGKLNFISQADEASGKFKTVLTTDTPENIRSIIGSQNGCMPLDFRLPPENVRDIYVIDDILDEPNLAAYHELARQMGIGSVVAVPVVSATQQVLGVLSVYYQLGQAVQQEELEILQQLVAVFSTVLEKQAAKQMQKELERRLAREKLQQQKRINEALLEGIEKQRLEMSSELHDNVNQILASAKLYMEIGLGDTKNESPVARQGLQHIQDAMTEIRRLSHELAPPSMRRLSLVEAICEHTDSLQQLYGIAVSFTTALNGSTHSLPEDLEMTLFRIVQEQTANIRKYAKAGSIDISLSKKNNTILMVIQDDGIGFDMQKIKRGLGLANIMSRAAIFNGKAEFTTAPGKGCRLDVTIPMAVG